MKYFYMLLTSIILVITFSCKTMNYSFSNFADENQRKIFVENQENSIIKKIGTISGIYSQKKNSYKFVFDYDYTNERFRLTFSTVLDEKLVFEATEEDGVKNYE